MENVSGYQRGMGGGINRDIGLPDAYYYIKQRNDKDLL